MANWSWRDGVVDVEGGHIELRYRDAAKSAREQSLPIALIGAPTNHVFPVMWLMSRDDPSHEEIIDAARKELDFYLDDKGEPDPWAYAKYRCHTAANIYSNVHWSYFPNGNTRQRDPSSALTGK